MVNRRHWKAIRVLVPPELYKLYANDAASLGNPLSAWVRDALSSYHSRWKTPEEKRVSKGGRSTKGLGQWCVRCNVPAQECRVFQHEKMGEWVDYDPDEED